MIHYHGGPVWPAICAYKLWRGRHAFVSFARPEQVEVAAEVAQSFALDNGAFTIWKQGGTPDWAAYYEWVATWCRHPGFDFALIPDVIDGTTRDNNALIDAWPFGVAGVPVWHLHESLDQLARLCLRHQRVALGSSGQWASPGNGAWWDRIAEAMRVACDADGRPRARLHGLRMLDPDIFRHLPFASADSTNVAQNITKDVKWSGTYAPVSKETRALVLAERIEQFNSAERWAKAPTQAQLLWAQPACTATPA